MEKKRASVIYSTDRKNEANKMFIIWLLPVWGTGNKCRTRDLTIGTLRYPGRGVKENGESLERGRRHQTN